MEVTSPGLNRIPNAKDGALGKGRKLGGVCLLGVPGMKASGPPTLARLHP